MAEATPIGAIDPNLGGGANSVETTATNAFGLGFEDLLRIVMTQLTYQDPMKPMESFEFVSQLAQFSQIQQTQTMSDRLGSILNAEGAAQATSLLGRVIDVPAGESVISGRVESISFSTGQPLLTITTSDNRTISSIALSNVSRIATGD
jgi:flagellar basal-body rod modification protein FlgD